MDDGKAIIERPEAEGSSDLRLVELFFFAYRDFIADADAILSDYGFGRAHHRVLHFVNHHPGMAVAELLEILRITKQSLGPVLRQLMDAGLLAQRASAQDRRRRLLYPTQKGRNLSIQLTAIQSKRIQSALVHADEGQRAAAEAFLRGMVEPSERDFVQGLTERR